jgi:signal transduction histidine kinase
MTRLRFTAQARLTLAYGALFLISGAALAILIITLTFPPKPSAPKEVSVKAGAVPAKAFATPAPAIKQAAEEVLAAKAQARHELRTRLMTVSGICLGGMTVVAVGLGWAMAGRVLRPVHAVSGTARRLSQRNLHERIPVSGPRDEMRELAETFNDMLGRLERAFEAQRRFAANASHELRGPMTTQRALVEVAAASPDAGDQVRQLADGLRQQLDRQQRLVDGLLALACSEHGVTEVATVDLADLVREHLDPADCPVTVHPRLEPAPVHGDPILLDLLVGNLLRNAVQHNVPGGQLWVRTAPGRLEVANTGPRIGAERLRELLEPFRRGQRDRLRSSGAGLGLAIVEAAATAHGAELTLRPRPGGGVTATVAFPARAAVSVPAGGAGRGRYSRPLERRPRRDSESSTTALTSTAAVIMKRTELSRLSSSMPDWIAPSTSEPSSAE